MEQLGMKKLIVSNNIEDVEKSVTAALQEQGFGILTEINVTATLKKKLDIDFRPYKILGACNPHLAHQAINIEDSVGLLLPCNVLLQQKDDGIEVSMINPLQMSDMFPGDQMKALMEDAQSKLQTALNNVN